MHVTKENDMTNEEKSLLLQDLCARLPYGIKCSCEGGDRPLKVDYIKYNWNEMTFEVHIKEYPQPVYNIEEVKPYLRLISSMTEKEKEELWKAIDKDTDIIMANIDAPIIFIHKGRVYRGELTHYEREFLISHHFDYSGLIPMGLALPALEGMYKHE